MASLDFPTEGVLPKSETGAAQFVEKNPTWDGRGVTVAIFDTGVDPGAAGLQVTSDGRPKIVDVVDCTGSGDVDISEVREIEQGATSITGLSGRTLKIGQWSCSRLHLGMKRAYELFPKALVKRINAERKEHFDQLQRNAESIVQQKLNAFEQADSKKTESQKKERKDVEATLTALSEQLEQYSDAGPVIDCIVFFDGAKWRAAIDTDCSGDLTKVPLMTNFRCHRVSWCWIVNALYLKFQFLPEMNANIQRFVRFLEQNRTPSCSTLPSTYTRKANDCP